jgi:hypothetical protein
MIKPLMKVISDNRNTGCYSSGTRELDRAIRAAENILKTERKNQMGHFR